jgi:hypothetical protein
LKDDRLKTTGDLKRVTRLPVLATLNNLSHMNAEERERWAFHTWTALQSHMSDSPNHGLVCGLTSSQEGEGRTTWINMLAEAATKSGFRVLTIATQPSPLQGKMADSSIADLADPGGERAPRPTEPEAPSASLTTNDILASPSAVTERLVGPHSQPLVHIPLPGWVWNLERRKQWQTALNQWRQIDNIVILVELPPASVRESVLLAENLPNLIWLADSEKAQAVETRKQLDLLRHARCNLVGTVLNHKPHSRLRELFPKWLDSTT